MILLGIDQGLANTGYAVIEYASDEEFTILESGVIRTKADDELEVRIGHIYKRVNAIIEKYATTHMGVERLFFNPSDETLKFRSATIIRTNMVSGVLFLLANKHMMSIKEYVPGTIKKHLTGNGRATKERMIQSVKEKVERQQHTIQLKNEHEADAIAIALKVGHDAKKIKED